MSSTDGCAPRAQRTGAPLNELIVATLIDSLTRGDTTEQPGDAREEQARLIERILGDLAVSLDVSNLPLNIQPSVDLPNTDTLRQSLPELSPPLSTTIIANREDRL
ncbi:MAG TPA: hypothetical protein VGK54_13125 [Chloroflexota bacterium]